MTMQNAAIRIVLFLLLLVFCAPANAAMGNCRSSAYLARFDARLASSTDFLCVEAGRASVNSSSGTSHIRLVHHVAADWAALPGVIRAFNNGIQSSARALPSLGNFRFTDVTILLIDDLPPGGSTERFGQIAARTSFLPGDECLISIWLLGEAARPDTAASVVAHEIFHCVQRANLSQAQMLSGAGGSGAGGDWWLEGSAEWFITAAMTAPWYSSDRVRIFDEQSRVRPLNRMAYEAYVFFSWLGRSRTRVLPFLSRMASSSNVSAQRTAMMAALGEDQWLQFAKDYMDQRIRDGQGASIGSTPQRGNSMLWNATRTQRINLVPFVLSRGDLFFECGSWNVSPRPARFHAAKASDATVWTAIPSSIDARDGRRREYRFVAMASANADTPMQITGTLAHRCTECAGTRSIDRCMIGTWRMTADGAGQVMRQFVPAGKARLANYSADGSTMTMNEDGTFISGARTNARISGDGGSAVTQFSGQSSGRWSASGGRVNMCPDAGHHEGTLTDARTGKTVSTTPVTMVNTTRPYTCTADTMRITMPIGRSGIQIVYKKVSGPR